MAVMTPRAKAMARFSKGNIKLGLMLTYSKLMGNDTFNTKYGEVIGSCGKHCEGCKNACYVKKSYRYPSVIDSHARNTQAFRTDLEGSFKALREQLSRKRKHVDVVRINQSGEIESVLELAKWIELSRDFPTTEFYLYTKNFEALNNIAFNPYIEIPSNFTVLISIWHEYGIEEYKALCEKPYIKAFAYMDGFDYESHGLKIETTCKAYENGKLNHEITCDKCKKCFSKSFKVIGCEDH